MDLERRDVKKLIFEMLAAILLTMLASSIRQVKVGKLRRVLATWAVVHRSFEAAILNDEVTLGEVHSLQKGVGRAIKETRRILKS